MCVCVCVLRKSYVNLLFVLLLRVDDDVAVVAAVIPAAVWRVAK